MKIVNFCFDDLRNDWHLKNAPFDNINLLVGLSGAGKTKILQAILALKRIANGRTENGIKWNVEFLDSGNTPYTWSGEFSVTNGMFDIVEDEETRNIKSKILFENLICNNEVLIKRENDQILYKGEKAPKLLPNKSAIYLLKEDPVNTIVTEMNKILFYNSSYSMGSLYMLKMFDDKSRLKEYKSKNDIFNSKLDMETRLLWTYDNDKELFGKIERHFCNIFPFIQGVRVDLLDETYKSGFPPPLQDAPLIQIKEKNIEKWILDFEISSGMFNTLMHLCEIYLCAENSIILIDELENSLGINCLGPISDEIIDNTKNTQSHFA